MGGFIVRGYNDFAFPFHGIIMLKTYPVLLLALLLAACGGQSESNPTEPATAPDITLNFVSDQQYSQEENNALQKATYIMANQCRPLF